MEEQSDRDLVDMVLQIGHDERGNPSAHCHSRCDFDGTTHWSTAIVAPGLLQRCQQISKVAGLLLRTLSTFSFSNNDGLKALEHTFSSKQAKQITSVVIEPRRS